MPSCASSDDESSSDDSPRLELDIDKLLDRATNSLHAKCIKAERFTRGASHEIYLLTFQASPTAHEGLARSGFACIARFTRVRSAATAARDASEIVTVRYLRSHTDIPVPEVYHHDLDLDNTVGAPYVLMERIPGQNLYQIWDDLPLDHKKAALSQITSVIIQFASLRFDKIGSLNEHGVGPLISPCFDLPRGPFNSTDEYLQSFVSTDQVESPELVRLCQQIQKELDGFLALHADEPYLRQPFGMIHADFDGQNMLFVEQPDGLPPKLSGVIDFEYSHTGPLYFLYEYPIFIQDVSWSKELYADNALLRAHFIREISQGLPDAESRAAFIACINAKNFVLNDFQRCFMSMKCSEHTLINLSNSYLEDLRDTTRPAYSGRPDYTPERYSESGELALLPL